MPLHHIFTKKSFIFVLSLSTAITVGLPFEKAEATHHQVAAQKKETLPLGKTHLPETRNTTQLTNGVTYTEITRGYLSDKAYYTVDIGFFNSKEKANALAKELRQKQYPIKIHKVKNKSRKFTDVKEKDIGYVVRSGEFEQELEAKKQADQLKADGYEGNVTFSEYDGTTETTGPWDIDVVEINPDKFKGKLTSVLAHDQVPGRETVSSMSKRKEAIAGINGGYFVFSPQDGFPGDPAALPL